VFGSKSVASTNPTLTKGMDRITESWDAARVVVAPRVEAARVAVAPRLAAARDAVAPLVDEAGTRLTPVIGRVRDDVVPAVATAMETARENSAPARAEAKERAAAALLALQGRAKQKKARRWPVALGCLAAGAIAGLAASKLTRRGSSPVTPTPFAVPTPASPPAPTAEQEETQGTTTPYPAGQPGATRQ
jgi:hypothetical protein